MFKLRIMMDNEAVVKAKAERFEDFEPLFQQLRLKFGDTRRGR